MIETKYKTKTFWLKNSSPDEVVNLFFDLTTEFVNKLDNFQHAEKDDNGKEYIHSFWKIYKTQDGQLKIHDAIHPAEGLKPGEETVGRSKNIFALSLKAWNIGGITKTQIEYLPFFENMILEEIRKLDVKEYSDDLLSPEELSFAFKIKKLDEDKNLSERTKAFKLGVDIRTLQRKRGALGIPSPWLKKRTKKNHAT